MRSSGGRRGAGRSRQSRHPAVADRRLRRARIAVSVFFLVQGLVSGVWMARIPAVKAQAHLSDSTLGAALFAIPVGLMLGSFAAERVIDRIGSARAAWGCGIAGCLLVTAPGAAANLPQLMAALFVFGIAGGMWDVAQNAQGVQVQAAYGRPVITTMHAGYSFGAILGSLAGGAFAWAGVAPFPSLAVVGAAGILTDAIAAPFLLPGTPGTPATTVLPPSAAAPLSAPPSTASPPAASPPAASPPAASPPAAPAPSATPPAAPPATPRPTRSPSPDNSKEHRRHVRRLIIAIGIVGICGMVGEGAAGDWTAVYLKDNLGTSAGFAALGFAAFSATMTAGRLLGDGLIHRFGVTRVARGAGLLATAGLAGALAITSPVAAVAGFAVLGAGLSVIVPQAFAAGGRADPDRPGAGIARVVGLSYAGLTAGPAVIGAIAGQIGLRLALVVPALLAAWIVIGAPALSVGENQEQRERFQLPPPAAA